MAQPVVVRKVESKADFKAFFEFPWTLYKDDPNWSPPLLSMRRDTLDKKKNPAWDYMEGEYFTAWRGDRIVGTITGHINHRHNEFHNERVGWFGMFEVYDDPEAASALLDAACAYVKGKGYDLIRGPQSFTTHEECGLLVDNFSPAVLLMAYNPPYYQKLVEDAGFHKVMDVYSYYYDREMAQKTGTLDRLDRLCERVIKRSQMTVRPVNRKNLKAEFELFKEIYNAAWEKNWGFVPLTPRELDALVTGLGQFFEPKLACFVEIKGDPAGFLLSIPNFNELMRRVYPRPGVPEPLSLLPLLWHWKIRPKIRGARVPLMGVKEQYRHRGVELVMFRYIINAFSPTQYKYVDCGWILEINHDLTGTLESIQMPIYRTHRFYEKRID